jgi:hypothetical protein
MLNFSHLGFPGSSLIGPTNAVNVVYFCAVEAGAVKPNHMTATIAPIRVEYRLNRVFPPTRNGLLRKSLYGHKE